jgi:hypothetical protein
MEQLLNCCSNTYEVWYGKYRGHDLEILFELLFYLTKLLNMAMVRNVDVLLRQTPNHSV